MTEPQVASVDCAGKTNLSQHTRALRGALVITIVFMLVEAAGGALSGSIALLADAGHMLGDAASLGLALFMAFLAQRPATPEKTYGYLRFEILAAVVNGVALFVIAGLIVWQAVRRLAAPREIESGLMLGVAAAGLLANLVAMRLLHGGHCHSLNVRGAYLHVLSDLLGSVGTLAAAALIALTGWTAADPIVSIVIAVLILFSAWRLLRESANVLLEATPAHIEMRRVEERIASIPGVEDVHDLHVWTVTSGMIAMTGHAVVPDPARSQQVLTTLRDRMADLGIDHVTVQLERERICR